MITEVIVIIDMIFWYQELEFLIVLEGGAIFYVGNNCYEVHEQNGIFVPPNYFALCYFLAGASLHFLRFCFHPNFLSDNYQSSFYTNYIKPVISGNLAFTRYYGNQ